MISITQGIIANNKKKDLINLVKHSQKKYNEIEKNYDVMLWATLIQISYDFVSRSYTFLSTWGHFPFLFHRMVEIQMSSERDRKKGLP